MIKGRTVAHISTGWPVTVSCRPCLIFLPSDWSMLVTWSEYWPLIGLDILICWMLLFLLLDGVIWMLDPLYAHGLLEYKLTKKTWLKCPLVKDRSSEYWALIGQYLMHRGLCLKVQYSLKMSSEAVLPPPSSTAPQSRYLMVDWE